MATRLIGGVPLQRSPPMRSHAV